VSTPDAPRRMALTGLHHVTLICADLDRTTAFYRDVLGLTLVQEGMSEDDPGTRHFWFGDAAGTPGTPQPHGSPSSGPPYGTSSAVSRKRNVQRRCSGSAGDQAGVSRKGWVSGLHQLGPSVWPLKPDLLAAPPDVVAPATGPRFGRSVVRSFARSVIRSFARLLVR